MNRGEPLNALAIADTPTGWDDSRVVRAKARAEYVVERDPRSLNHMAPDVKLIHARLEEWSAAVRGGAGVMGYPPESIYVKWRLSGVRTQAGHEPEIPDRVAHVDAAVARLCEIDRSVIKRYYLGWRPVDIWKFLPGIPNERRFKSVLRRARWRVDGYLSAIESV